jgi:hypothetical protein
VTPHAPAAVLPGALDGRLIARADLDARTKARMFQLLGAHFTGVDRTTFERDLAEKTAVIRLDDDTGELRGFSTLLVYATVAAGRAVTVVYSGDTIVERPWWGSPALARTWIRSVRALTGSAGPSGPSASEPLSLSSGRSAVEPVSASRDVYWMLLTSGFRTYRFLPVFYRSFYPRVDAPTPPDVQATIDAIAAERFGDGYDPARGIVRFARPQVLAGDLLDVPRGRELDPHVRFFLARNPGYVNGDELVCLTRVHDDNLTPAGGRMARRAEAAAVR